MAILILMCRHRRLRLCVCPCWTRGMRFECERVHGVPLERWADTRPYMQHHAASYCRRCVHSTLHDLYTQSRNARTAQGILTTVAIAMPWQWEERIERFFFLSMLLFRSFSLHFSGYVVSLRAHLADRNYIILWNIFRCVCVCLWLCICVLLFLFKAKWCIDTMASRRTPRSISFCAHLDEMDGAHFSMHERPYVISSENTNTAHTHAIYYNFLDAWSVTHGKWTHAYSWGVWIVNRKRILRLSQIHKFDTIATGERCALGLPWWFTKTIRSTTKLKLEKNAECISSNYTFNAHPYALFGIHENSRRPTAR